MSEDLQMRRYLLIFFILVLLLLTAAGFFYLNNPRKALLLTVPDLSNFEQLSLRLKGDSLFAKPQLMLQNKGLFRIHIQEIDLHLLLASEQLLEIHTLDEIDLQPGDSVAFSFLIELPLKKLKTILAEMQGMDSMSLQLKGNLRCKTLLGAIEIPVNRLFRMAVPVPPEIEVGTIRLNLMKWPLLQLTVEIDIHNAGTLDLQFNDVKMEARIEKGIELHEKEIMRFHLRPKSHQHLSFPLVLAVKKPITASHFLFDRKEPVDYEITMTGVLRADDLYDGEIPFDLRIKGRRTPEKPDFRFDF